MLSNWEIERECWICYFGVELGIFLVGFFNVIIDVGGVFVGYVMLIEGLDVCIGVIVIFLY